MEVRDGGRNPLITTQKNPHRDAHGDLRERLLPDAELSIIEPRIIQEPSKNQKPCDRLKTIQEPFKNHPRTSQNDLPPTSQVCQVTRQRLSDQRRAGEHGPPVKRWQEDFTKEPFGTEHANAKRCQNIAQTATRCQSEVPRPGRGRLGRSVGRSDTWENPPKGVTRL